MLPDREIKPPNRPAKLCQRSDKSMKEALKAVHDGKMSINRAAVSPDEEEELAHFLVNCSEWVTARLELVLLLPKPMRMNAVSVLGHMRKTSKKEMVESG